MKIEKQKTKIAYLGPVGTFSHEATIIFFKEDKIELIASSTIEDLFFLVENNKCEYGVTPIESSTAGSVVATIDSFCSKDFDLKICGENFVKVNFHLLASKKDEEVKKIYAHPMAMAQCQNYIKNKLSNVEIKSAKSNSDAAEITSKEKYSAAISNSLSASIYDLETIEKNIDDHSNGVTRFVVVGRREIEGEGKKKTSLVISLKHEPGSLYRILGALAEAGINVTRIESRPMKVKNWEYYFFLDFEGDSNDNEVEDALDNVRKQCTYFKNLGSYLIGQAPWS